VPRSLESRIIGEGLTFDDLLLVPAKSKVLPHEVDITTHVSRTIAAPTPLLSAAMSTVTESELAIAMAQEGGIGVIHRDMSIEMQVQEVRGTKRNQSGKILDPETLTPSHTVGQARTLMEEKNISGIPIIDDERRVKGIITRRDLCYQKNPGLTLEDVMTRNVVTAPFAISLTDAQERLLEHRIEKLPLLDERGRLAGLITHRDIDKAQKYPHAMRDHLGRLRVAAAVGVGGHDLERAQELEKAGVDLLVIDTSHGHSLNVITMLGNMKARVRVDVMAGNIATGEAARDLVEAGADAVKVGIGPASICTSRVIAGIGVPQMTAIALAYEAIGDEIPIIADGGIRYSGDITKALAAGARAVMIGSLFAGTEESPGEKILYQGHPYKAYWGMGSEKALATGGNRYFGSKPVPEGIEGLMPFKGSLAEVFHHLVGGLRAGMGYTGCHTLEELRERARFVRVTAAGIRESHIHDVVVQKQAPNYQPPEWSALS